MEQAGFIRDEKGILWDKKQISKEAAMALYESKIWVEWSFQQKSRFQLFQQRLSMPFDKFHKAVEKTLNRSVWTHEFGLSFKGIQEEFLGIKNAPSFEDIMNLIPEEKRIFITI
jgi:hypothetical protein